MPSLSLVFEAIRVGNLADGPCEIRVTRPAPWDPRVFVEVCAPDGATRSFEMTNDDTVDSLVNKIRNEIRLLDR